MLPVIIFGAIVLFLVGTSIIFKVIYWIWYATMTVYVGTKNYIERKNKNRGMYDHNGVPTAKYWQTAFGDNSAKAERKRQEKEVADKYIKMFSK